MATNKLAEQKIAPTANNQILLNTLNVICWIVFIGFCVQTGTLLFNAIWSLLRPDMVGKLYLSLNLSELQAASQQRYINVMSLVIFISGLKAFLFFVVLRAFQKINLMHPFHIEVAALISKISYVAFSVGLLCLIAEQYCDGLIKKGSSLSNIHSYTDGGAAYIFMAGIIFFVAQIYKKAIEIQSENELTV